MKLKLENNCKILGPDTIASGEAHAVKTSLLLPECKGWCGSTKAYNLNLKQATS
jgi:hypothetical protein